MQSPVYEIFDYLKSGNYAIAGLLILMYALLVFVMLPTHELAHAFAADKLGDNTPRWNGRLTFNPLHHLDLMGTAMLLLCGFGYARPVPVNPRNFKNPKRDMALTAFAGPLSNLLMAVLSLGIFRVLMFVFDWSVTSFSGVEGYVYVILVQVFAAININLAVFNLLPLYPLDGSRIFAAILPDSATEFLERNQRVVMIVVLFLLFFGALDVPMHYLRLAVGWLICTPMGLPNYFA